MAALAIAAKLSLMNIIMAVTGITVLLEFVPVRVFFVTQAAGGLFVPALEAEFGMAIVIEPEFFPFLFHMTTPALAIEQSPMHIVDAVAVIAAFGCFLESVVGMTALASGLPVLSLERKFCFIVVKLAFSPTVATMAILAVFAQLALVHVLFLMAIVTGAACLAPFFPGLVTFPAAGAPVPALKGKVGEVVVENILVQMHDLRFFALMLRMATATGTGPDLF